MSGAILARRRPSALWSIVLRATTPEPAPLAPFCPGCVLMSSIERAIHAVPLVIAIRLKRVKQVFPLARLRLALEAIEHRLATNRTLQAEPAKEPRPCATTAPLR